MPSQDIGAVGAWQKLLKLQTTASVMHTTAHPDDEHGGLLAMLSRGQGARVSMLTLTRGESGDNAIGPELFDAVGLIRTEELLSRTATTASTSSTSATAVDYGFSKRLDEALDKWGSEHVLREVVRVIRTERPFVVISRFQGNAARRPRQSPAAGLITQQAFKAAADPKMFPEQIEAGLRPWQALKLYMGGVRDNEDWTIRVDTGEYDPVLGESYQTLGRLGLSFQRSQNSGRFVRSSARLSLTTSGCSRSWRPTTRRNRSSTESTRRFQACTARCEERRQTTPMSTLAPVDREIKAARAAFSLTDPSGAAAPLARALSHLRSAIATLGDDPDVRFILEAKERQIAGRHPRVSRVDADSNRAARWHAGSDGSLRRRPAGNAARRAGAEIRGARDVRQPQPARD